MLAYEYNSKSECDFSPLVPRPPLLTSDLYAFMLRRKPSPDDGETTLRRGLQQFFAACRWLLTTFGCGLSAWLLNFNYCYIFHTPHTQKSPRKWQWESGQREWEMKMEMGDWNENETETENGAIFIDVRPARPVCLTIAIHLFLQLSHKNTLGL